jgi:hypothetical protein
MTRKITCRLLIGRENLRHPAQHDELQGKEIEQEPIYGRRRWEYHQKKTEAQARQRYVSPQFGQTLFLLGILCKRAHLNANAATAAGRMNGRVDRLVTAYKDFAAPKACWDERNQSNNPIPCARDCKSCFAMRIAAESPVEQIGVLVRIARGTRLYACRIESS